MLEPYGAILQVCVDKRWDVDHVIFWSDPGHQFGTALSLYIYGCFRTPKSSILIGFSIINHQFWDYHHFRKHPYIYIYYTILFFLVASVKLWDCEKKHGGASDRFLFKRGVLRLLASPSETRNTSGKFLTEKKVYSSVPWLQILLETNPSHFSFDSKPS